MDEKQHYKLLVQRYVENKCTAEELEVFFHLLNSGKLKEYLADDMDVYAEALGNTSSEIPQSRRIRWGRYAAAAAIIVFIAAGILMMFTRNEVKKSEITNITPTDIKAPATNRAMIKLSNGQVVYLDSAVNGQLAMQGEVNIMKLDDGKIVYNGSASEIVYNTLTNPRGSKVIDMTLADGSRVWLNAGSSVTYPVAFAGGERNVSVAGEAYFEVTSNKKMPFRVQVNNMTVEVLGTHFNINSYSDEPSIQTTLLEGSVKISTGSEETQTMILRPGQQAHVKPGSGIRLVENADLEQVMAWKNGLFQFRKADIQTVMRQLSCWYDVEVMYEGKIPDDKFGGNLPRDSNISVILKALEQAQVHFRIEGRKIIVMP